tara:strand:- start:425 stop:904 length:480 start_codon:yes stop_codon:yes gene_type:complete
MIEWRTVAEAPEYSVSNTGLIRSIYTNRPLAGGLCKNGYQKLVMCTGGRRIYRRVCALVCAAFHGPRPRGMVTRHLNGRCDDNRAENLAWSTQAVNIGDKVAHGTAQIGIKHPAAILTEDDVRAIRASVEPGKVVAARYGMSIPNVYAIRSRRNWRHVE